MYEKLRLGCQCLRCAGCNRLENQKFKGAFNCDGFRQADKRVWCADEVVDWWNKTGKVMKTETVGRVVL